MSRAGNRSTILLIVISIVPNRVSSPKRGEERGECSPPFEFRRGKEGKGKRGDRKGEKRGEERRKIINH